MEILDDALRHEYGLVSLFFILLTLGMTLACGMLALLGMTGHRGLTDAAPAPKDNDGSP